MKGRWASRCRRLGLVVSLALALAPPAFAVDPNTVIGGAGSQWFSGSLLFQSGTNCSVLGNPYSETMVSGIASYGGLTTIPSAGAGYWTSLLLSVPGNPCGPGSSAIATDVLLPPGTTIDSARPIRCFGQPRNANTFGEITNETWSFLGSSGRYCPTAAVPSALHAGAFNLGFRPIASGQLFQIFVPVKSSQALLGAAANPVHEFRWLTDSTGVFSNPGQSYVWANVLPAGSPSGPFVYFERDAAVPFWKADAPAGPPDTRNRAEFWANVYTAGLAGNLCFEIRRVSDNSLRANCQSVGGFNGAVGAGQGIVRVLPTGSVVGPNGGYAPAYFDGPGTADPEWDQDMKITWTFTPTAGAPVSRSATFHTLAGPDTDLDGVADIHDACPSTKGTLPNGCQPTTQPDPDGDGIYGAADLCPSVDGRGALNGCPGGDVKAEPTPTPTPTTQTTAPQAATAQPASGGQAIVVGALAGTLATKPGSKLARKALLAGAAKVNVTCSRDAAATVTLSVDAKTAKKLKLKAAKGRALVLASGSGPCTARGGGAIKLAVAGKYRAAVKKAKGTFPARLVLALKGASGAGVPVAVKIG